MTVRCPDCGDENPSTRARCGSCGGQLRISALDTLTTTRPELVILDIGAELIDIFEEFSFGSTGPDPVHAEALLAALQLLRDIPEEDVEEALDELLPAHRAHAERLLHKARETRGLHPSPPRVRAAIQAEAGSNSFLLDLTVENLTEGRGRVQPQLEDRGGDLTVNDVLDKHGSGRPTRHKIVGGQCKTTYQVTGRGRGSRIGYFEAVVVLGRAAPQVWRALLPYHLSGAGGGFVVHASGEAVVYAPGVSRQPQAEAVSNEAWAVLQLDLHETWRLLRDRAQATRPPKAPPKRQPAQPLASALLVLRKGGEVTDFALLHGMERPALGHSSSEADVPVRDPKDVEAVGISRKLLQLECEGSVPLLRRLGKSGVLVGNAPVGTQEEIVLREDGSLSFARAGADPLRWRYHVLAALPACPPRCGGGSRPTPTRRAGSGTSARGMEASSGPPRACWTSAGGRCARTRCSSAGSEAAGVWPRRPMAPRSRSTISRWTSADRGCVTAPSCACPTTPRSPSTKRAGSAAAPGGSSSCCTTSSKRTAPA